MKRAIACLWILVGLTGCASGVSESVTRTPVDQALFGPSAMRLHPVFTQLDDWTGDGQLDGIEAVLEMQDQFGDPTKAAGRVIFELYEYKPYSPDPRGRRLVAPWEGRLDSIEDQRARWNRVNRAYIFQLACDVIRPGTAYVLTATFELSSGGRFFDQLILQGEKPTVSPPVIAPPPPPAPETRPTTHRDPTSAHTPPPRADQP
ncbi:MAG: hypothetical protein KatS3mg104_2921 [Phycisphaerae bacterium]|jgi:hypothetical protein|nr:MAG: hypothetical protein KatS3mg104_2921 [Phycisphaerae bacterium]